jgi:hypothetical protein
MRGVYIRTKKNVIYCGKRERLMKIGKKISMTKKRMFASGELVQPFKGKKNPAVAGKNNGMYGVRFFGSDNHFYGRKHTEATKRLISLKNTGQRHSSKSYAVMQKKLKERYADGTYVIWNKGKICPNLSNALKGKFAGKKNPFYGKTHTVETRKLLSEMRIGRKLPVSTCMKMSTSHKGLKLSEDSIRKILRKVNMKPNKFECDVQKWLDSREPNVWRYCGDGSVIINGHCPDFINCNGQKKVILANGLHWHQLRYPDKNKREIEIAEKKIYEIVGFDVNFIWYDDFYGVKK